MKQIGLKPSHKTAFFYRFFQIFSGVVDQMKSFFYVTEVPINLKNAEMQGFTVGTGYNFESYVLSFLVSTENVLTNILITN